MKLKVLLGLLVLVLIFSCASPPKYLDKEWHPGTIAILPFTNDSADVALEKFARQLMFNTLKWQKFEVIELETVDAKLNELGITEGGQLNALSDEDLQNAIPADSFMYGHVIDAKRVMLGIYYEKMYHAEYKIVDRQSMQRVFEDEGEDKDSRIVLDPAELLGTALKEFAAEITADLILKMLNSHPLYKQMENVTNRVVWKIPKK
ncbi:MAG: hypothetical protein JW969_14400 [Spirochaetales bacterium]|nr:hypothetical protein [Spirochaetales bacterium]